METLVVGCLISAVVVFILDRFYFKNQSYLKWVALGFVAAAALIQLVHTIQTLVIVCLVAAVLVVILKLYVFTENQDIIWIAVGCIVVAALLIAVLNMGAMAVAWLVGAGGVIGLQSYFLNGLPPYLRWSIIGCVAAAALFQAIVSMGPLGAVCLLGAIIGAITILIRLNLIPIPTVLSWVADAFEWVANILKAIPSRVADAFKEISSWVAKAYKWLTNSSKSEVNGSKPAAESSEAIKTNGGLLLLCLIAAVVVVITIWFVLKDIPVLKWVTSGCIAIAVAFVIIRVSRHGGQN
ncbi:uncharacterized protein LOC134686338 [Mytilus trossulus]|uniref:uncharacterized protein LOC134686338 n=1 Tax=Mytilus trossulus TaxID=6551 RepID=UPI0030064799